MAVAGELDRHVIERRLDMRGQLGAKRIVVEVAVQIGQDRPARLDARDQGKRLLDVEMARMRLVAQRIHDPDLDAGERLDALRWQSLEVAGIGQRPETE